MTSCKRCTSIPLSADGTESFLASASARITQYRNGADGAAMKQKRERRWLYALAATCYDSAVTLPRLRRPAHGARRDL